MVLLLNDLRSISRPIARHCYLHSYESRNRRRYYLRLALKDLAGMSSCVLGFITVLGVIGPAGKQIWLSYARDARIVEI